MANDCLLVLSGRNVFREVELSADTSLVRVGTTPHCDVRFRRELFFSSFELELSRTGDNWTVTCVEGDVYLSADGVVRLMFRKLEHGDRVDVRYANSGATLFTLSFTIDFERERGDYDRIVDVSRVTKLTIGGRSDCDIVLNSGYTAGDLLVIQRQGDDLWIADKSTRFGAFVNGRRLEKPTRLADKTFFSVANFYFYYDVGQLRCSSKANIQFKGIAYKDEEPRCETSTYPLFTRNTRIKSVMDDEKIPILDPPSAPQPPQGNIIVSLLPALLMLAMTMGMRYFMAGSSNMNYMIMSGAMMSVGILTSVFGIISERQQYKRRCANRITSYNAYLDIKRNDVRAFRKEELEILNKRYPSIDAEMGMVQEFSGDLFDRSVEDEDFLDVRLGTGPRRSVKQVDFKPRERFEADELTDLPQKLYEEFYFIQDAPISIDFRSNGAIGVVGTDAQLSEVLKNMVVDVATRHFQTDVKVFFICEKENEHLIHWARNLPHVSNEELGRRNVVCDEESRNVLFEYLYKTLSDREAAKRDAIMIPHFVIFVVDECGLKNHPLSRFIENAEELGATFVFFEGYKEYLPKGCEQVVFLAERGTEGNVVESANDRHRSYFDYKTIDDFSAWMVAQTLAPVYSEEVSLEGSLTQSYSLFEMLDVISADDLDLDSRWAQSVVYRSMAAPIGISKAGMVELDLSDRADGPHGLVAGTTGSGKSETLLTYLVSVATLFHPHEVAFMIIDFKGGGMALQLQNLPHLIGTITNIDGREIDRSLKSIEAELQKRQRYFAEAGVNHIDNYIRLYKSGQVKNPLPHLVIVVDEFAELKADQPEFMAELISAARIGRSLGVHLILATQKPAGQVNEQIWSNSRFKLCLKVQSREDSNEVLKSPLAAEIKEPGRAYLQVGNNEKFELFQSAYSGGPEHQDDEDVREFSLYAVENSGRRVPIYDRRRERSDEVRTTQLDAVVNRVRAHCEQAGIEQLPSICLPPLPETVNYPAMKAVSNGRISLGMYDDPDSQYQGDAFFDLANSNIFVVGSSQTGKTNLLEVMIRAIAESTSPEESAIYIIDFASMILRSFERLAHVGGVVISSEDEKLKNLFKLLGEEIATRKARLLEVGVSSFTSYLEAGYTDLPHIYVIMDNFAVFRELYAERFEEDFLSICREGLTYGISMIVSNSSSSGFGYKYMSNFSTHIAFTCNDSGEYSALFDRCRMEPRNVPGRALCSFDKNVYEFQTWLCFEGEKEIDRVKVMRAFVDERNSAFPGMRARRIPSVPDDLDLAYIRENYEVPYGEMALALNYETVAPAVIDLTNQFQLSLVGEGDGNRALFMQTFMADLEYHYFDRPVEVYVVDNLQRDLAEYESKPYVVSYYGDYNQVDVLMPEVSERFDERFEKVRTNGLEAIAEDPYLVVVINSSDAVKRISEVNDTRTLYERMASQARGMRVLFVFAEIGIEAVGYAAPAVLKSIKEARKAFVFASISEQKLFDVTAQQSRQYRAGLEPGQAFAFSGPDVAKVRFAVERTAED